MTDPTTRLREALLPACATTRTYTATDGHPSLKVLSPGEVADAILATLVEHRDEVLTALGMTESGWTYCATHDDIRCEPRWSPSLRPCRFLPLLYAPPVEPKP
jgi:hypothetical protein